MGQTVAAASVLPPLRSAPLVIHVSTLDDDTLTALMRLGPRVREVKAQSVLLQSDQHAHEPWPWKDITITDCDVASVARLPDPACEGPRPVLQADISSGHQQCSVRGG